MEPTANYSKPAAEFQNVTAGRDIKNTLNYLVIRGVEPYKDFLSGPLEPWDIEVQKTDINHLRKKLLQIKNLKKAILITVEGTLYPAALLSPGWWERQENIRRCEPRWRNSLQKWLFYGFDLWGPSWDFSWNSDNFKKDNKDLYFIGQLGDGDEVNSLPVIIPLEKARKLHEIFMTDWGGVEVSITGLLGHRHQFSKEPTNLELVGGLLDYCIWLNEDDSHHKISPLCSETEIYSGYLWKCMAPKRWFLGKKTLNLNDVFFITEHTNFARLDAINYNLDSLAYKEEYIRKLHGDLVLLQKSSSLVLGNPEWSICKFYDLLMGKKVEDI